MACVCSVSNSNQPFIVEGEVLQSSQSGCTMLYLLKEALEPSRWACVTPHMCSVCWVNDHMYCSNMRRTSRDLPPHGGCLHYIPCEHYQRETISKALAKQRQEKHLIRAVISDVPVIRVQKVDETPNQDDVSVL